MAKFQYRPRTADDIAARIQETASDSQGVIMQNFKPYTVRKGDNHIRILPATWDDARHWAFDVYLHYSAGPDRTHVICNNRMKMGACFGCEQRSQAERAGDETLTKELMPRRRAAVWLIDRNAENEGPQIWLMPATLEEDIQSLSIDKTDGSIYLVDDPYQGYDVTFDKTGERLNTKYVSVQIARRASQINPKMLDYVADNPLPNCLIWRTYEEVKEIYEGGMGGAPESAPPAQYGRQPIAPRGRVPAASSPPGYPPSGQGQWEAPAMPQRRPMGVSPTAPPPQQGQWDNPPINYGNEQYAPATEYAPQDGYDPNYPPQEEPPWDNAYVDPNAGYEQVPDPRQQQYAPPPQRMAIAPRGAPPSAAPMPQQRRPMPPQQQAPQGAPPQGNWNPPGRGAPPQGQPPQRGSTSARDTAEMLRNRYQQGRQ